MNYVLVYSSNNEINIKIAEGKLKNAGFDVKTDYSLGHVNKVMKPNLFGVYVIEHELERARAVLVISELQIKNPNVYISWQVGFAFVLLALGIFFYIKTQIQ